MIGEGQKIGFARSIAAVTLTITLAGCQGECGPKRAATVARSDIAQKDPDLSNLTVEVVDDAGSWIVAHTPPPGGMGGIFVHKIDKKKCTIQKVDIGL